MRRLLIILGYCCAALLLALAALPWWLAPVLRAVGHHYGAEFSRYERVGYARFALHDVAVAPANVRVRVDRIETETPLLWLFHRTVGRPAEIAVTTWRVDVEARSAPAHPSRPDNPGGALHVRAILFKVASGLERWAPHTAIGEGAVTWPGGGLKLAAAQWRQRTLQVRDLQLGAQAMAVTAEFTPTEEIRFAARPAAGELWQASLTSVRADISGAVKIWGQSAPVSAQLPPQGWMPASLQVAAENWKIPATRLALGATYAAVRGGAQLSWHDGAFVASVHAIGDPLPGKKAPPLSADLHATGGRNTFTIDALAIDGPGVAAKLSAPVMFDYRGRPRGGASRFTLEATLEKQPWLPHAQGRVVGEAAVTATTTGLPQVAATLSAHGVTVAHWALADAVAGISLDWPRLQLKQAVLGFADGSRLTARGECDLQAQQVTDLAVAGTLHSAAVAPWLPAKMGFDSLEMNAHAHGPFAAMQHEGHGKVTGWRIGQVRPLTAEATWRGRGTTVEIPDASIAAGATRLAFTGTLTAAGANLATLRFSQGEAERLTLAHPVQLQWSPRFDFAGLQLTGGDASISLSATAGDAGRFDMAVRNLPSAWLADFLPSDWPQWRLATLDAQGRWDQGPLTAAVRGELSVELAPGRAATVQLAAQAGSEGVQLESLRVAERAAEIVNATGQVPLMFYPRRKVIVELKPDASLALHAATTANPAFWKTLSDATGLEFQQPEVTATLSGTWAHPRGEITAKAARLAVDRQRIPFRFPTVEALDLHATVDSALVTLDHFSARVEGQDVRVTGRLPLAPAQWPELRRAPVTFLRREGSWRLEVPDADVAAIARYMPGYLAASGHVQIDASVKAGGEMTGSFRLRHATTLPLGPLGVLQEVQADVQFEGRTVRIASVTAQAGGQPVTLSGRIELAPDEPPRYDLRLRGDNLPLVRQTGLLLRADLDLKLATPPSGPTTVTGNVKLRDSMFLSDVRAFIPKGGASDPLLRPPFFSIDLPPFNAWRLGIEVRGEKFLRLRSPVFVGVASAHFRLGGTLGAPRATGDAVVESGQALLPFATFQVNQGTVRLTEADPYTLRIYLTGTSRRYGYDLRMEVTGSATEPIVTFSSSPPLDTSQLLLMITAGEVPQDQITYSTNQRAARFGAYLGQSLINDFGGDATDAERLSISSGERVSREGRETYDIEYRLTNRLTAVGEYDEFDDYNAGLKWSLLKPRQELSKPQKPAAAAQPPEGNHAPAH